MLLWLGLGGGRLGSLRRCKHISLETGGKVTRPGGAMVAQQTSNLKVVGSIPTSGVIFLLVMFFF